MDITMIGLQNAGKTSLLRVLAVSIPSLADCKHLTAEADIRTGWRVHDRVGRLVEDTSTDADIMLQLHPDSRLQYEACPKGPCDPQMVCACLD